MPIASNTVADSATAGGSNEKNIWIAAGEGDLERVRHLVEVEGISPIAADQFTYTPLHAAASYGQIEILRFLLNHPNTPQNAIETTDSDGDTPLFVVEDVSIARTLIEEFGANAKHENHAGDTPAANAEENELEELAAYLRGVTGEEPMYQRGSADQQGLGDLAEEDEDEGGIERSAEVDAAIEQRTEAMMVQVQDILRRAEARGANSGEELNEEEEAELRRVVGENILTQVREGWGVAVGRDVPLPASLTSNGLSQSTSGGDIENLTDSSDADRVVTEDEEEEPRPGR